MRKTLFCFIFISLFMLGMVDYAQSAPLKADSTQNGFAATGISSRYITVPVGTIVAWPQTASLPGDADPKWRECDGRSIPTDSDLYRQKGMGTTPNLYAGKGYFLRASSNPRNTVADKFASHNHGQPSHTHSWNGQLVSTALTSHLVSADVAGRLNNTAVSGQLVNGAITGTAAGQTFAVNIPNHTHTTTVSVYWNGLWHNVSGGGGYGWAALTNPQQTSSNPTYRGGVATTVNGTGNASAVTGNVTNRLVNSTVTDGRVTSEVVNTTTTGNVNNGTVSGWNADNGGDDTYYTGEDETAPMHYTTRYFIRIND